MDGWVDESVGTQCYAILMPGGSCFTGVMSTVTEPPKRDISHKASPEEAEWGDVGSRM